MFSLPGAKAETSMSPGWFSFTIMNMTSFITIHQDVFNLQRCGKQGCRGCSTSYWVPEDMMAEIYVNRIKDEKQILYSSRNCLNFNVLMLLNCVNQKNIKHCCLCRFDFETTLSRLGHDCNFIDIISPKYATYSVFMPYMTRTGMDQHMNTRLWIGFKMFICK